MKSELKAKWVEALRSGEYSQIRGALREPDEKDMCCLGVLLDVSAAGNWEGRRFYTAQGACLAGDLFPYNEMFGLPTAEHHDLVSMNDGGKKFPEIADWIEANIPSEP